MKSQAVLLRESGLTLPYTLSRPLEIVEVDLAPPSTGEVLVRIEAAGICHSDLSLVNGTRPRPLPVIAGHESAGIVIEIGPGVRDLKVGDHVISQRPMLEVNEAMDALNSAEVVRQLIYPHAR